MKENWPKMRDKQKSKDPLAYQKQKRVCHVEWGNSFAARGEEGETCSSGATGMGRGGSPFFRWGGKRVWRTVGEGTSRASEVKGRAAAHEAARSERRVSPWPLRHWRRSRLGSRRFTRKEERENAVYSPTDAEARRARTRR